MTLIEQVRSLAASADNDFAGSPKQDAIQAVLRRISEPLRVAIAGQVKAGKSTLLNALVGEELAPTDAGECTKVVTWYRDGKTYRVTLFPNHDAPIETRFERENGALDIDLGAFRPEDLDHMEVEWPSASLRAITLIDTPGIASLSRSISAKTRSFLTPDDEHPTEADAVLYLLRHLHNTDIRFLESFHDVQASQATPINAIGVLSRADEIGVGRVDAMNSARKIAHRYQQDPQLQRLCQAIVPVAGLVGQAGVTLTEGEYRSLAVLASLPQEVHQQLLSAVDRFVAEEASVSLIPLQRQAMLERFGLYGIRLGVYLIQAGKTTTAKELSQAFRTESGIDNLQHVLVTQFTQRSDILKARSGLLALDAVTMGDSSPAATALANGIERIEAMAHDFAEMRLLNMILTGGVVLRDSDRLAAARLLGSHGRADSTRLDQDPADSEGIRAAAFAALSMWQSRAENPMSSRSQADAARILVQSCEAIISRLPT